MSTPNEPSATPISERTPTAAGDVAEASTAEIATHFAAFDADGDGAINFAEFERLLTRIGLRRDRDLMHRIFASVDTDGDGLIVLAEFASWWAENGPQP